MNIFPVQKVLQLIHCKETLSRWGHFFGAVAGFLVGMMILKKRGSEQRDDILKRTIIVYLCMCVLVVTLLVWHKLGDIISQQLTGESWFKATGRVALMPCDDKGCQWEALF